MPLAIVTSVEILALVAPRTVSVSSVPLRCLKPVIPADMVPRHPPVACSKMVWPGREQV